MPESTFDDKLTLVQHILNQCTANFDRISNSIEISLVGRAPGGQVNILLSTNKDTGVLAESISNTNFTADGSA